METTNILSLSRNNEELALKMNSNNYLVLHSSLYVGYFFETAMLLLLLTLIGCSSNPKEIKITEEFSKSIQKYDEIANFSEGLARVKGVEGYGFIDRNGVEVILCSSIYDNVEHFSNGLAQVWKMDKGVGFINKDGVEIIPCGLKYDRIESFVDGLARVDKDMKYGFIDTRGREVIPLEYDYAENFSEGLAKVVRNDKWGMINKQGIEVVLCQYDKTGDFNEGMAIVSLNGKYGVVDALGKEIVSCKYDIIERFSEGVASFKNYGGDNGYIDKEGNEIINLGKRKMGGSFSGGLAIIHFLGEVKSKVGFIDLKGNEVIAPKYDYAQSFSEGLAVVEMNGRAGFIDMKGNEVISLEYESAFRFEEGLAMVKKNGRYGFIDKYGKEVIPLIYENIPYSFSDGLAKVKREGKWGYVNNQGEEVVACLYDDIASFSEGLARAEINGKYGFVDKYGNDTFDKKEDLQIEMKEKEIQDLENENMSQNYYIIQMGGKSGISNGKKDEIIPLIYDCIGYSIEDGRDDFFIVQVGGKMGVVNKEHKIIVPIQYDEVRYDKIMFHDFFMVEFQNKKGLYDKDGFNVVPCEYDYINITSTGYPYGIFSVRQNDKFGCVVNGKERIPCNYYSVIITDDYIVTSLQGELNPQRAMYIGNKYQVYENGYQISERGYAYNNEMINSVDSEYSTSNEEMNIDDELTMKLLQKEKEIRSAVDELARLEESPSLSANEILKIQLLKQTIVRNYDEALNIAKQSGDKDLAREYERRRNKTVRALQMMKR